MTSAVQDVGRSYDEVPYDAGAIPGAHPDNLAVVGVRWGMEPPAVERSRVLELGCSSGENLRALAIALPNAEFIGIDASPRQIEAGRARCAALGVHNVTLECRRIEELPAETGTFDYILCHGVFSWVNPTVQQQILQVCARMLAPMGLAYISYNTLPGWHLRQQLRNMLLFHVHGRATIDEQLAQTHALLSFMADALEERTDAYGCMLRDEVETLRHNPATYICHEFLEEVNAPVYFHDFVARAHAQGLRYVDEARPLLDTPQLPPGARDALVHGGADRIATAQYLDFLAGRSFRRSVLCRNDVRIAPLPAPDALTRLSVAAAVTPERQDPELTSEATEAFRFARGQRLQTNHPAMKTALAVLGTRYPRSIPFADLCRHVEERLAAADVEVALETRVRIAEWLRQCHDGGLVELHTWQAPFALEPSERPCASPLARSEAAEGAPLVTSLRHTSVALHPFDRSLLALLDGTLEHAQLVQRMAGMPPAETTETAGDASGGTPADAVAAALHRLAVSALLLG